MKIKIVIIQYNELICQQVISNQSQMAGVTTFITVVEKILIVISIICFIPTSVFVFAPTNYVYTSAQINSYTNAYKQVFTPFIVGFNTNNCTSKQAIFNNEYCLRRADSNLFSVKWANNYPVCQSYSYKYNNLQFCSGIQQSQNGTILNHYTLSNNTITLQHSDQTYPIFAIYPPINSPLITYYHYAPDELDSLCKAYATQLTSDVQNKITNILYKPYEQSSRFLWYTSIPTLAVMLILIIVNQISNMFNFRKYILMACYCLNVALLALIIKGIKYYSQTLAFRVQLALISLCFVKQQQSDLANMANIDLGVGFGFVFFMGVVALLIFLSMVLQLIAKLVQMKYYKVRQGTSHQDTELSDMKTSLRSRKMRIQQSFDQNQLTQKLQTNYD